MQTFLYNPALDPPAAHGAAASQTHLNTSQADFENLDMTAAAAATQQPIPHPTTASSPLFGIPGPSLSSSPIYKEGSGIRFKAHTNFAGLSSSGQESFDGFGCSQMQNNPPCALVDKSGSSCGDLDGSVAPPAPDDLTSKGTVALWASAAASAATDPANPWTGSSTATVSQTGVQMSATRDGKHGSFCVGGALPIQSEMDTHQVVASEGKGKASTADIAGGRTHLRDTSVTSSKPCSIRVGGRVALTGRSTYPPDVHGGGQSSSGNCSSNGKVGQMQALANICRSLQEEQRLR